MKKKTKGFIALLALFALGSPAITAQPADTTWTLQECINEAIAYNLSMKRQELLLENAELNVSQSKLALLPNLNGNIEHQLGSGRVLDQFNDNQWVNATISQGDLGLQSNLVLFNGLRGYYNMKLQKANYHMQVEDLEAMEDQLTLQVMTAYLALLRNEELVEVARLNKEVTEKQVDRMLRLVEVGNESRGKLLEVKAQNSEAHLLYTQAVNTTEISRLDLMHLLNNTSMEGFGIEKPVFPDPSEESIAPMDTVFSRALKHLAVVRSAKYGVEVSERTLAVQRSGRSPQIYARGLLYTNYSDAANNPVDPDLDYTLTDQLSNNQYKQVAVGVSIPIFNRWQVQTGINQAKINLQDAQYLYDNTILELQKSVQQVHTEAVSALENYHSAQESVANGEQVFRFAEERFQVGTGTALEMQEARRVLYESTADMISSRYMLIFYTKILDYYMGMPMEL